MSAVNIAETRRAEHNRHLLHRIESATQAMKSFTPLGSTYDPGGHMAAHREAQRQTMLEDIERCENEIARIDNLSGDELVKMFVPEASIQEVSESVPVQGQYSGAVVSATGQVLTPPSGDVSHARIAVFGGE